MSAVRTSWRMVAAPLIGSRVLVAGMTMLAAALLVTGGIAHAADDLVRWDAVSYMNIAAHGYAAVPDPLDAFLPGLPLLIAGATVLTRNQTAGALLVCFIAEALALWLVALLVRRERDRPAAVFCVLLLAFAPTAIFFTAPFTEAPFVAAAAASLYWARQRRMVAACSAAAVAASFRLTGLALLPALAIEMLSGDRRRALEDLLLLPLVVLPLALYCVYMSVHTGDALALFHAEASPSFGQSLSWPWNGFNATWQTMASTGDGELRSIFAREVAFGLLGLLACIGLWVSRRIPRSFAVYCSVAWLMTASLSFWRSQPRYILALFPALILVADATQRLRGARPVLVGASAVLMCLGTVVYVQGRWLG